MGAVSQLATLCARIVGKSFSPRSGSSVRCKLRNRVTENEKCEMRRHHIERDSSVPHFSFSVTQLPGLNCCVNLCREHSKSHSSAIREFRRIRHWLIEKPPAKLSCEPRNWPLSCPASLRLENPFAQSFKVSQTWKQSWSLNGEPSWGHPRIVVCGRVVSFLETSTVTNKLRSL